MADTVWCVSSRVWPASKSVTIDGNATVVSAALGGLYLVHPTASLNMLARFVVAMTAAGVAAPAAFVTEQRFVRLTSSGVFAVTWTDTNLRDYLGFAGNLAGASSYTAPARSALLWSPGKTETPELSPLGTHGQRVLDVSVAYGTEGRQTIRTEGSPTIKQRFSWRHVGNDRYLSAPPNDTPGEFTSFWLTELTGGQRWTLLRGVSEGSSTTASASYGSATALGPYKADASDREFFRTPFVRSAGFERVDGPAGRVDISIPCVKTPEFA